MKPKLRVCYAETPLRHYTWLAVEQTLCGIGRPREVPFSTGAVDCVACIAVVLACPPGADLTEQIRVSMRLRGLDF